MASIHNIHPWPGIPPVSTPFDNIVIMEFLIVDIFGHPLPGKIICHLHYFPCEHELFFGQRISFAEFVSNLSFLIKRFTNGICWEIF